MERAARRYYCTLENRLRFRVEQLVSEFNGYNIPVGCQMDILRYKCMIITTLYYVCGYNPPSIHTGRSIILQYIIDRSQEFSKQLCKNFWKYYVFVYNVPKRMKTIFAYTKSRCGLVFWVLGFSNTIDFYYLYIIFFNITIGYYIKCFSNKLHCIINASIVTKYFQNYWYWVPTWIVALKIERGTPAIVNTNLFE